jgi:hypothetical protein
VLGGRRDCDSKQASEREWTSPVECRLVVEWNDRRKNWFGGAGAGRRRIRKTFSSACT